MMRDPINELVDGVFRDSKLDEVFSAGAAVNGEALRPPKHNLPYSEVEGLSKVNEEDHVGPRPKAAVGYEGPQRQRSQGSAFPIRGAKLLASNLLMVGVLEFSLGKRCEHLCRMVTAEQAAVVVAILGEPFAFPNRNEPTTTPNKGNMPRREDGSKELLKHQNGDKAARA